MITNVALLWLGEGQVGQWCVLLLVQVPGVSLGFQRSWRKLHKHVFTSFTSLHCTLTLFFHPFIPLLMTLHLNLHLYDSGIVSRIEDCLKLFFSKTIILIDFGHGYLCNIVLFLYKTRCKKVLVLLLKYSTLNKNGSKCVDVTKKFLILKNIIARIFCFVKMK